LKRDTFTLQGLKHTKTIEETTLSNIKTLQNTCMIFDSQRLYVRSFTVADSYNFYALNGNEEIMRYIRSPKTREQTDTFLKEVIENEKDGSAYRWALVRKEDDLFVGSFAIIPLIGKNRMQLGYALLKNFWGNGYASEITWRAFDMHSIHYSLIIFLQLLRFPTLLLKKYY
jgi:ribosomal-protein-alanine N-acetyltransferase